MPQHCWMRRSSQEAVTGRRAVLRTRMERDTYSRYICRASPGWKGSARSEVSQGQPQSSREKGDRPQLRPLGTSAQDSFSVLRKQSGVAPWHLSRLWSQPAGCSTQLGEHPDKARFADTVLPDCTSFCWVTKNYRFPLLLSPAFLETHMLEKKGLMPLESVCLSGASNFLVFFNTNHYSRKRSELFIEHLLCRIMQQV